MCCKTSTSSANAAGFVLVGESVPARVRGKFMLLMASATMYVQFVICGKIFCTNNIHNKNVDGMDIEIIKTLMEVILVIFIHNSDDKVFFNCQNL